MKREEGKNTNNGGEKMCRGNTLIKIKLKDNRVFYLRSTSHRRDLVMNWTEMKIHGFDYNEDSYRNSRIRSIINKDTLHKISEGS